MIDGWFLVKLLLGPAVLVLFCWGVLFLVTSTDDYEGKP